MQPNLLLAIRCRENGMETNINVHILKQILLFHLFLPFILKCVKKVFYFQNIAIIFHMFSIFIKTTLNVKIF